MMKPFVHGSFPRTRLRRLRTSGWTRHLVAEHRLSVKDLIWPLFVTNGERTEIATLPGVSRYPIAELVEEVKEAAALGIPAIAIFPCVDSSLKSDNAAEALNPDNLLCRAVRAIKETVPHIGIIGDVALDPYTSHGQDGIMRQGTILNDETVDILCRQAIIQAEAGCDVIAPSDMMDGRIGAIRDALDKAGYLHTQILSYAVKYASHFYGPFRDAVGSAAALGRADKRSYQMDPANILEALHEVALDVQEGADMVMVKPGMPYLDVVRAVRETVQVPVLAYQVSGEYAMLRFGAQAGAVDYMGVLFESLLAFKRAGATAIFTYAAKEVALELHRNS